MNPLVIKIDDFIFHVVHNGQSGPTLMESVELGTFESFFIDRINEILEGNKFSFVPGSAFLGKIKDLEKTPRKFLEISKDFARDFHSGDGRIKAGVMVLMRVTIDGVQKYILIKYDHEEVVYYTEKKQQAILSLMSNTFSKSKSALQKSAIIDIITNPNKPNAVIIDKSDMENVTDFFKNFLGIQREYSNDQLTDKVRDSLKNTVKAYHKDLPEELTAQVTKKFNTTAGNQRKFEAPKFIRAILGPDFKDEMEQKFMRELKNRDISGEVFTFKENLPSPKQIKYKTAEGILIRVPSDVQGAVTFKQEGKKKVIVITTTSYTEE